MPPTDPFPTAAAHAFLASIVESSDDAIVSKDLNGTVTSWNRGAELLFGYTAEEMVGQSILRLIPVDRLAEETEILDRIRRAEKVDHFETVRRRKDGSLVDVSVTVSPIRDANGVVVGASKIARDITQRRLAEEVLRDANQRRNEFLAMLGHELRNPLAAIRSSLAVIRRSSGDNATTTAAEEVVERQVGQLGRLVDDLLDADRITRGRLNVQPGPILLSAALIDAVNTVRPRMDMCEQTLTVSMPREAITLNADATRLGQILGNLLDNASKFTGKGGTIALEATREDHPGSEASSVHIRVRDTGIGLAPDQLSRIFELFTQVDTSLERSVSGLGIGLPLVKTLVEKHGGEISVSSAGLGHGSEFTVTLPASTDVLTTTADSAPVPRPVSEPLRVLIVDDNKDAAEMLTMVLRLSGHDVHMVHDGEAAVREAAAIQPNVILLDIGLPKLNGYEAAKQIRAQQGDRKLVIVALTGWGQDADRRRSADSGFDAHWVKPVDDQKLERFLADLAVNARSA
jgi:two-component system CheB/CheR fusion protein